MSEPGLPSTDFARWADPLVGDVIQSCYRGLSEEHRDVQFLIRCQGMLWRALIMGTGSVSTFHREVIRTAMRLGLGENQIEDVNRQVITELMLVITSRHARSPRHAAELCVQVAQAYRRLAEVTQAQHQAQHA